jgi:undecaprenyl-diphosphatase
VGAAEHRIEEREGNRTVIDNEQAWRAIGIRRKLLWCGRGVYREDLEGRDTPTGGERMTLDAVVLDYVMQLRRPWLDDLMVLASALGAGGFVWIIFGTIAGIFPRHTAAMWRLWLAVAVAFLVSDDVVKPLFARPRPFEVAAVTLIDARPTSESFPSAHSAMAAAGALAGARMLPVAGLALWPLALLVIVSRVYLGVHWPTDVIVGALLGFAVAWFVLGGRRPRLSQD